MANDDESGFDDVLNDLLGNDDEEEIPSKTEALQEKIDSDFFKDDFSLENIETEQPSSSQASLKDLNFSFFNRESNVDKPALPKISNTEGGSLYKEDDSSDDEDKRNFEEQKYSDYGRDIKRLLSDKNDESGSSLLREALRPSATPSQSQKKQSFSFGQAPASGEASKSTPVTPVSKDIYADPFFGLRIINPVVSSTEMKQRMNGKRAVRVSNVSQFLTAGDVQSDWVIAGVLTHKSMPKTSQKGSQFNVWTISDLSEEMDVVSMFMFSSAYKALWKTSLGSVVGFLNPNVLDPKDASKKAVLSVDNAQRVMILGISKDMGKCKSLKKNGEPCSSIVNLSRCEYCVYHVKKEYKKFSLRPEIQSSMTGRGFGQKKANDKIGSSSWKQNFTPVLPKRNDKHYQRDQERLALLTGAKTSPSVPKVEGEKVEVVRKAVMVESTPNQAKKDFERMQKLRGWAAVKQVAVNLNAASQPSNSTQKLMERRKAVNPPVNKKTATKSPALASLFSSSMKSNGNDKEGLIDLSEPIVKKPLSSMSQFKSLGNRENKCTDATKANTSPKNSPSARNNVSLTSTPKSEHSKDKVASSSPNGSPSTGSNGASPLTPLTANSQGKITSSNLQNSPRIMLSTMFNSPTLNGGATMDIDLSIPVRKSPLSAAKLKALSWVKNKGVIQKSNPNKVGPTKDEQKERGVKRVREAEESQEKECKKSNVMDKFKELLGKKSLHEDLVEEHESKEQDSYFKKLELKERLEEKMLTTFKVDCKAVRCLKCKYTAFSASDLCKEHGHPLRVIDAVKKFFKCSDCGNRTVSLDRMPSLSCTKCNGSKWKRAAMMDEKKMEIAAHKLCIRGGEEKFIGSDARDANVNMLVPDGD